MQIIKTPRATMSHTFKRVSHAFMNGTITLATRKASRFNRKRPQTPIVLACQLGEQKRQGCVNTLIAQGEDALDRAKNT